jgi:DHA1 family bicyclomycin/chloramphenicol resistance-like MFS transporter
VSADLPENCVSPQNVDFKLSRFEFVAMIAMLFATIAFSMDAMLPALPEIAAELAPEMASRAPLILTAFFLGMGVGTFLAGPLSDAYGRRRIVFVGLFIYIVAAAVAWASSTLEVMLIARVFQGLGASGPRVVSAAIIRDLFSGREMARIISFVMMIFTLVPVLAPALGALIILWSGWRGIFLAFIIFAIIVGVWMAVRLPETLPMERRRPLKMTLIRGAVIEMFSHPTVRISIAVQTLAMSMLIITLMLVQPIYDQIYDRAASFPYWFGGIALVAGSASLLNALLVVRYGMRRLVTITLGMQILLSGAMLIFNAGALGDPYGFAFFVIWQTCLFFQAGLTLGNLNAIAMEPMGHIAGMAASVTGAFSTVIAALLVVPISMIFDGTTTPLVGAVLIMAAVGFVMMLHMGRLERHSIDQVTG